MVNKVIILYFSLFKYWSGIVLTSMYDAASYGYTRDDKGITGNFLKLCTNTCFLSEKMRLGYDNSPLL